MPWLRPGIRAPIGLLAFSSVRGAGLLDECESSSTQHSLPSRVARWRAGLAACWEIQEVAGQEKSNEYECIDVEEWHAV